MRTIAIALAALLIGAGLPARASIPVPISLKDIYTDADNVAIVEVVEGRVVNSGGETCGARYKGRVVESVKGATAGEVLEFGYSPFLKVGAAYLILLGKLDSTQVPGVPDLQIRCKSVLPASAILANWRGALEIEGDTSNPAKRASWTVRPPGYVIFPLGTRSTIINGEKQYWLSDLVARMKGER